MSDRTKAEREAFVEEVFQGHQRIFSADLKFDSVGVSEIVLSQAGTHIDLYMNLEEAKQMRQTLDEAIADLSFEEGRDVHYPRSFRRPVRT